MGLAITSGFGYSTTFSGKFMLIAHSVPFHVLVAGHFKHLPRCLLNPCLHSPSEFDYSTMGASTPTKLNSFSSPVLPGGKHSFPFHFVSLGHTKHLLPKG
jgi:hypothetical protein